MDLLLFLTSINHLRNHHFKSCKKNLKQLKNQQNQNRAAYFYVRIKELPRLSYHDKINVFFLSLSYRSFVFECWLDDNQISLINLISFFFIFISGTAYKLYKLYLEGRLIFSPYCLERTFGNNYLYSSFAIQ